MIDSQIRYRDRLYKVSDEKHYDSHLDFPEVFREFQEAFNIVHPGIQYRDFDMGGAAIYAPPTEEMMNGIIMPLTSDDIRYSEGGTYTRRDIKIYLPETIGYSVYFAKRIDKEDEVMIATLLESPVSAGTTVLPVESVIGFTVGMPIRIFEGADGVITTAENTTIVTIGADYLVIDDQLTNPYGQGAVVKEVDYV